MTKAIHATITGRVQGVGFRAWTQRTAQDLGLAGWVRNRSDGSVETLIEGESDVVGRMRKALASGPPSARVDKCSVTEVEPTETVDFRIR